MHIDHLGGIASTAFIYTIPPQYGYVLIVAVLLALEILLIGFIFPGKLRGQIFTEQYMKTNFGEEHLRVTGKQIQKGGYPDMGNGRYCTKLTYDQWYRFNNAQRAHINFVEFAPSTFVMLLIAGIYFPVPGAVMGLAHIIGRILYSVGYASGGPKGRMIGALINDLTILGLFGLGIASGVMMIQQQQPL